MPIIRVDFYKHSGKWYAGGNVDVGKNCIADIDFKQNLVNNQNILQDGWQRDFYVVTNDVPNENKFFNKKLFLPEEFIGIRKEEK